MRMELLADVEAVALRAATFIADAARAAIAERGQFVLAVSGGTTPWRMLRHLATVPLPWEQIQIVQVDERVAPLGDPDRNLTHLRESLFSAGTLPVEIQPMPVQDEDLASACADYGSILSNLAGVPPVIDLVHLGLGADGHTASLVPGDPVLEAMEEVACTGVYQGRQRMTLTFPCINRARQILWLVTGSSKTAMLKRLLAGDTTIPAGRISANSATILADNDAAANLP